MAQGLRIVWDFHDYKQRRTEETTNIAGSAGISLGFFRFGASGGQLTTRIDETKETTDLLVEFQNLGRLVITPGLWFSKNLINTFKDGKDYIPGSPITKGGPIWWPNGRFASIPKEILLAYKTKITITLSATRFSEVRKRLELGGGLAIGPFLVLTGSGGNKYQHVEYDEGHNRLIIEDTTPAPLILAVINEPMGQ